MAYSASDKKDFILKDMKAVIGMGVGNAFAKAVDYHVGMLSKLTAEQVKEIKEEDIMNEIFQTRDLFFMSNQEKIVEEYNKWLKENEEGLDRSLGLVMDDPEPL